MNPIGHAASYPEPPWSGVASLPAKVWLEGDRLRWRLGRVRPRAGVTSDMLDGFIRIQDDADVLAFAYKFGVLALCDHGLPASHNPSALTRAGQLPYCEPLGWDEDGGWEPTAPWYRFVEQAKAILEIAAQMQTGEQPSRALWEALLDERYEEVSRGRSLTLNSSRELLAECVSGWLHLGRPSLEFEWSGRRPDCFLAAGTFGLLSVQLVGAITGGSIAKCSYCPNVYQAGKAPSPGQYNACPDCRKTRAPMMRKRDQRAKAKWRKKNEQAS